MSVIFSVNGTELTLSSFERIPSFWSSYLVIGNILRRFVKPKKVSKKVKANVTGTLIIVLCLTDTNYNWNSNQSMILD